MMALGSLPEKIGNNKSDKYVSTVEGGLVEGLPNGASLSTSLFRVHVRTPEGFIDMAAETVLLLKKGASRELEEVEIEQQMRVISAYRFAFSRARALLIQEKSSKQISLNQFCAEKRRDTINEIGAWRSRMKENQGIASSWFGSITKQEIEERFSLSPEYLVLIKELSQLELNIETLKGLEESINSHGFILKSLAEKVQQDRYNK